MNKNYKSKNAIKFCSTCGNRLSENDIFCGKCGQKVHQDTYKEKLNDNNGIMIVVLIILVFVITLLAVLIWYMMIDKDSNKNLQTYNDDQILKENAPIATTIPQESSAWTISTAIPTVTPTEAPTVAPTTVPIVVIPNYNIYVTGSQYLFDSDKEYITYEYLNTKTQDEIRLILNEIYARHGYIFKSEVYKQYFLNQSWYVPRYSSDVEAEQYFNGIERQNKIIIANYEASRGWR